MRRRVPRCGPGLRQLKRRIADPIQRRVRPNGTVNQPIRKPTGLRSTFRHAFLPAMYRQPRRLHPLGRGQDKRVFAHGMDVQVLVWSLPIPHTRLMSFYPCASSSFLAAGVAAMCPKHPISRAQRSRQIAALGADLPPLRRPWNGEDRRKETLPAGGSNGEFGRQADIRPSSTDKLESP